MSNRKIDADAVAELARRHPTWSNYDLARELGCDEATIRRAKKRPEYKPHLIPEDDYPPITVDRPIVIRDADAIITADWHVPLYDPEYVNAMIERARHLDVRTLVIAGDFFNFDALSAYDPKQDEAGLEGEIEAAQSVMSVLGETFDRIVFVWGNHDARLHRALGYKMQFKTAMNLVFGELGRDLLAKIEFTNLDHVWFEFSEAPPDRRRWYICHPQSYSRIPLSTARQLTAKMNANVITAHAHHCAVGYGTDGRKIAAEIGGFFDRTKTQYLQRSTTFPNWQQGYGYLLGGRFFLTTPDWGTP